MIDSWQVLAVSLKKETQSLVLIVVLSLRPLFRMTEVVKVKKNNKGGKVKTFQPVFLVHFHPNTILFSKAFSGFREL